MTLLLLITAGLGSHPRPVHAKNGMVVSTSRHASQVGIDILKNGGNAVDAAVAVGFALAVTSSSNGNIGGGGFLVYSPGNGDAPEAIDYRETAPAAATETMFQDQDGNVVSERSRFSHKAAGVPGTVAGLALALALTYFVNGHLF